MVTHLGVDWGQARTGVAISDEAGRVALPLTVVATRDLAERVAKIAALIRERGVQVVVVGNPVGLDGRPGKSARTAQEFAHRLGASVACPIVLWDERLTTRGAQGALREAGIDQRRGRELVDQVAATLILQSYLDHKNGVQLKDLVQALDR